MPDTYSNTGTNADYASKMPDLSSDADIQKVIQAYHYGDPVNASAGSFSGSWTDPALGVLGKLIYLNDTLTTLDSAKIGKSLLTAKGGLIGATAASTPAMLAAGTNGHVLKANSSTSTGLEWYSLDTTHLNLNPSDQTLTGDLTMSKASPRVAINASSGHSYITSSGASGSEAGFLLSTASVLRWGIQKIASGDNLSIIRYNDGGSAVGTPLAIDRSTGLTTLSSLTISGATTGTTLSMSGTGSFGGKLSTVASGTSAAGLNIPTGTAPSSPVSGDMWTTTDGVYVRIDSTTYPLAIVADGPGGLSADNVTSGILAGQYGGTGVNNSGKTITLGGNLTTSGAYGLTLTLTGATSVTLPTSGTLVNSAVTTLSSLVSIGTVSTGVWQGTVVAGQYGGTGVNNSGKTITLGGNLTTSGAHSLTLTLSGATNVTLPTSGTLVNSAVTTLSSLVSIGTIITGTWNGSVIAGQYGGTGVANTGKTITISGNTTIGSSTNTVAFVTSGNTSVTLPTSGTLATLASPTFTGTVTAPTFTASTSLNLAAVADTATAATHYYVETATDGLVRPKTLANVKTEVVTTAAVNSAAATTVGTITSGTWQGTAINATYIDSAIARLASPTFTGTPLSTTAAVDTNTTQIATTAYVVGQGYLKSSTASSTYAPLASPTFTGTVNLSATTSLSAVSDTATAATHYYVETATDGLVRPKTLANVKAEIVTTAAVNSAAATTVGTVTSGTWQGTAINATYIDSAIARLASPTFTGTTTTTGVEVAYSAKTANYTLTSTDYVVDATANSFTFTLPASTEGRKYVLKNSGTGTITVDTTSSQTIDGELTFNLGQHESITVVSDGSNWVII